MFFTSKDSIEIIKQFRRDLPTYYIELEIEDFYTYKYKNRMMIDPTHCPSIELNLIWNEKIFMIQKVYQINPFNTEWFKWIDAGICIYRNIRPPTKIFPDAEKISKLPIDKFIYSQSKPYNSLLIITTNHYHHISGTSYIIHKTLINKFVEVYKSYIEKLVDKNNIWTDQVILSHMYKNNPSMFFKLCDGYGEITAYLF